MLGVTKSRGAYAEVRALNLVSAVRAVVKQDLGNCNLAGDHTIPGCRVKLETAERISLN
jgi:hypothetical protein